MGYEPFYFCDPCKERGEKVPATNRPVISLNGGLTSKRLDLCDDCNNLLVVPLEVVLAEMGTPVVAEAQSRAPQKRPDPFDGPVECDICNISYSHIRYWMRHAYQVHQGGDHIKMMARIFEGVEGGVRCVCNFVSKDNTGHVQHLKGCRKYYPELHGNEA